MSGGLHARARHLGWAGLLLVVTSAAGAQAAHWLSTRTYFTGPDAREPVAVLLPLVAAVLVSVTLVVADPDLERTMPRVTPCWRLRHALLVTLVATVAVAVTAPSAPADFGSSALSRNALGLVGLVLLATRLLPTALSWAPMLGYCLAVYLAAPHSRQVGAVWWAWPVQDGRLDGSWVIALVLVVAGLCGYARVGAVRLADAEG